jgi:hypothetical protein
VAEVDGDSKPRAGPGQPRPRRLRDISHLYLTKEPQTPSPPSPAPRRALRLGFAANGDRLAKTDVCGNIAVQLARLGQRTFVLDLDPILPNAGFHLGLAPAAYMAHLRPEGRPLLERGLLGMRVLEGVASDPELTLDAALRREILAADCVLVNLPAPRAAPPIIERLRGVLRAPARTTMARVGSRSRMFGEWLQGARGASGVHDESDAGAAPPEVLPFDALVYVHGMSNTEHLSENLGAFQALLTPERVRVVAWGDAAADLEPRPWACIRSYPLRLATRQPLSSLYPEHPVARLYQSLAQSFLAGLGGSGGVRG